MSFPGKVIKKAFRLSTHNYTVILFGISVPLLPLLYNLVGKKIGIPAEVVPYATLSFGSYVGLGVLASVGGTVYGAIRRRAHSRTGSFGVIYSRVELEWRIREDGTFEGTNVYTLRNIGEEQVDRLPGDDALWFKKPIRREVEISVPDAAKGKHKILSPEPIF